MTATKWNFVWQPLLAVIYVGLVLWVLSLVNASQLIWAVGAGALSSSSCIAFASPTSEAAHARNLMGGYLIGVLVGVAVHLSLLHLMPFLDHNHLGYSSKTFWMLASISVGFATILMALCRVLHPPAVGLSLVLVLDIQHYAIVGIILLAAFVLAGIRFVLNPYLKSLF